MTNEPPPAGGTATMPPPEPAQDFETRRESLGLRIQHILHAQPVLGPLAVLIISVIAFTLINSRVMSAANLSLVLQQVTVIAILALGQRSLPQRWGCPGSWRWSWALCAQP